ncbi:hypothetical protein N5079_17360 [Planotetraspora sp. A-T 1434]|uniref:hypothetical protein n=1 Tax=Planotetraspora sp. A-T 1434 TaxID=2979219 RepID=UPI0021BFFA93|nr:hypothetical protein [Planotetraspora sp. A-T 1434]MCT9931972.1 hypothetical protein [Planotetraspora sp. A-T 1434]
MDLMEAVFVLARRWTITVPLLLLTIGAVTAAYFVLPWTYESSGTIVFLTSKQIADKNTGGNPYLSFDGSLSITAELVGRAVNDELTAQKLAEQGLTGEYETQIPPDSRAPLLKVTVTDSDPRIAQATMEAIIKRIPSTLNDLQKTNTSISQVRQSVLTKSTAPDRKATSKIRSLVGILAVGMLLTAGVPLVTESVKNPRRPIQPKRVAQAAQATLAEPAMEPPLERRRMEDDAPTAVHVWPPAATATGRPPGEPWPDANTGRGPGQRTARSTGRNTGRTRSTRRSTDVDANRAETDRPDAPAWRNGTSDGTPPRRPL